jgi:2',3'-cyclic-nucleotide 2'-phosphodiesterase (5'-nucleotidase family)
MIRHLRSFRDGRVLAAVAALSVVGCAAQGRRAPALAPAELDLIVAATTDVHGWLRGWDYFATRPDTLRGLARAATIVDSLRQANGQRVILVDAGDLLQGTPLTYLAARRSATDTATHPVIAAMNAMRYDAAAIGNHEFNYGLPVLERAIARARFPFLATNAYRADGSRAFRGWHIVDRAGVKVGIVGATNPGAMIWDRDHLRGRLVVRDIVSEVRTAVAEVRRAGAQVVIASMHSGLAEPASYDTSRGTAPSENVGSRVAREVSGIDAIVIGHSHREIADTTINGVLVIQPRNWATSVAVATLKLQRTDNGWRVARKSGQIVRSLGHAEHPAVIAAVESAHRAAVGYAATTIGRTAQSWRADSARAADTPLIDFVSEVQRRATNADVSAVAAFSLEAQLDTGAITVAEVARLYPYENTVRAIRVTGRQLRAFLEHSARYYRDASNVDPGIPGYNFDILSGVDYALDLSRPVGQRVTRLERRGQVISERDTLVLALNNYRQTGGGGFSMLEGAPVVFEGTTEIREMLIDEVRRRGTLRHEDFFTRNWHLEPAGAEQTAYRAVHGSALPLVQRTDQAPRATRPIPTRGAPPTARVRVIATNDFHGALEARPDGAGVNRGGAAALATMIKRARAECAPPRCQTILLDGGDMFQGTPASNLAFGRPVAELYNHLGYAAAALGNHEFDWGTDTLRARMRQGRHAILGANVRDAAGRDVPWIRNDTLVTRGPYRIGVIGIATVETPRVTRSANIVGLRFVDPVPIIDSITRRLRTGGAHAVIVIAHAGAFCERDATCTGEIVDVARRLTQRPDAIVSGHTHTLVDAVVNGIPIVQARSTGRAIGILDIPMGQSSSWSPALQGEVRDVVADTVPGDSVVSALVRRAVARVASRVEQPIALIRDPMQRESDEQYALGNLITDAQRWRGNADIAVLNNGGIRADLRAGQATYGSLFEIQPFGNTLHRLTVRGDVLREYLERIVQQHPRIRAHVSGVTVHYDPTRPNGQRIARVVFASGRPLEDAGTYTLIVNDFLATGGDGLGLAGRSLRDEALGIEDLDALIAYLRQRPQPVTAPAEARFIPSAQ